MTVRYCVIMFTLLNSLALPLPAIELSLSLVEVSRLLIAVPDRYLSLSTALI